MSNAKLGYEMKKKKNWSIPFGISCNSVDGIPISQSKKRKILKNFPWKKIPQDKRTSWWIFHFSQKYDLVIQLLAVNLSEYFTILMQFHGSRRINDFFMEFYFKFELLKSARQLNQFNLSRKLENIVCIMDTLSSTFP